MVWGGPTAIIPTPMALPPHRALSRSIQIPRRVIRARGIVVRTGATERRTFTLLLPCEVTEAATSIARWLDASAQLPHTRNWPHCLFKVSIHAPARGATRFRARGATPAPPDQHRPVWFRSTPPRGGRRALGASSRAASCFDPRPRAGGDSPRRVSPISVQFRSTPPRGGRRAASCVGIRSYGVSIHAPARGATAGRGTADGSNVFRSTPPRRGATAAPSDAIAHVIVSIHAPARGAT